MTIIDLIFHIRNRSPGKGITAQITAVKLSSDRGLSPSSVPVEAKITLDPPETSCEGWGRKRIHTGMFPDLGYLPLTRCLPSQASGKDVPFYLAPFLPAILGRALSLRLGQRSCYLH